MTQNLCYIRLTAEEQEEYHVDPIYNNYAANALGLVIYVKYGKPFGKLTPAGYEINVKGENTERVEMFKNDFIYTLFCDEIPEEQRVYYLNGKVTNDNIKNLSLQDKFQPHPVFNLYEANDSGIIRNIQTKKSVR